jgi:ribonuclease-3
MSADLRLLEAALGYTFPDRELLARALTHKSRSYEELRPGHDPLSNEQLEFLGDSILGFVVSASLYRRFPTDGEGRLSRIKAHLVSESRLYEVAQELSLGDHLILGRGEELSGGRAKKALLANAVEAVIAAVYLDGGIESAARFIEEQVIADAGVEDTTGDFAATDFKGALLQRSHALKLPPPTYSTVAENGPDHAKTFTVEVRVGREWSARAEGFTKKAAGQQAARMILGQLPGGDGA